MFSDKVLLFSGIFKSKLSHMFHEVMSIYKVFLLELKVVEHDSACLQKYATCKGFRCFFYFKSRKSSNDEDVITIPWYDLKR